MRKVDGPTWYPTARMRKEKPELPAVVPPGPENPMGTHAMYLGWNQYAVHGTEKPFGIGRRVSSGCIRLYPEDIITLFNMTPVGTKVTVVNQPIKVGWIGNELFMEAHPNMEDAIKMEETGIITAPKITDQDMQRIIRAAGVYKDRLRWPAIRTAVRERRGYPISIARRPSYDVYRDDMQAEVTPEEIKKEAKKAMQEVYPEDSGETETESLSSTQARNVSSSLSDYRDSPYSTLNP